MSAPSIDLARFTAVRLTFSAVYFWQRCGSVPEGNMDSLGTIADWCSIVGIPLALIGLLVTYCQVRKVHREAAKAWERRGWGDMVKFINVRDNVGVTTAYFEDMPFLPRVGERVTIPE